MCIRDRYLNICLPGGRLEVGFNKYDKLLVLDDSMELKYAQILVEPSQKAGFLCENSLPKASELYLNICLPGGRLEVGLR